MTAAHRPQEIRRQTPDRRRPAGQAGGRRWLSLSLPTLVLAIAIGFPTPAAATMVTPGASDNADSAAGSADGFSMNLYESGDFASQRTIYWCVGASMQMMLNILDLTNDDSRAGQERYMRLARARGPSLRQVDHGQSDDAAGVALRGAGSSGWARGLLELGAGAYRQQAMDGYDAAVRAAAYALRRTGRPVGLIVWRGAHAWVMSGFTATADPIADPDFRVTGVYIQDPWYPRVSSIWGPGHKPNSLISTKALKSDFLPRRGGRWHAELAGMYVLVEPVASPSPLARYQRMI
jgi:hypothetical protein